MNQHDPSGETAAESPRVEESAAPFDARNSVAMAAAEDVADAVQQPSPADATSDTHRRDSLADVSPAAAAESPADHEEPVFPAVASVEESPRPEDAVAIADPEPEAGPEVAANLAVEAADEGEAAHEGEAVDEDEDVDEKAPDSDGGSLGLAASAVASAPQEPEPEQEEAVVPSEPMCWYVLKVQSNRERTIRDSLLRRIKRDGLEPYFGEIVIPTEKRVETKGGKKRVFEHKLYPGYIMIHMALNDETWYLVRDTSGVGDFTGAAGKPLPMPEEEVRKMISRSIEGEKSDQPARVKINFATGDAVKIKEGPFESFEGSINSIDEASGKVSVLIEIFGRSTPVDLEYWQVERV